MFDLESESMVVLDRAIQERIQKNQ